MKVKRGFFAFVLVCIMLLVQLPFSVFAEGHSLSPNKLPNGVVGFGYWERVIYHGNSETRKYTITEGSLPPGLELDFAEKGYTFFDIEGKPTKAGSYSFTIQVKDASDTVLVEKKYTVVIDSDYPLEISTDSLGTAYEGSEYSSYVHLTYSRSATWKMEAVEGETLPEGLMLNSETGDLYWENPVVGKYNLKFTATRNGNSVSKVIKLIIEPQGGCKHPKLVKTPGKPATCRQKGAADYWYCDACENYYLNEECTISSALDKNAWYTKAFHSDKNNDDKCDTCEKIMPIFKKVTDESEITSGGMYLAVSKIGDKYYTLKAPEKNWVQNIEAVEINKNADGTFDYFEPDTGVMILETEFCAESGELDAGLPRYSLGTTINNLPYSLSGGDYSGSLQFYLYENSKYGYRIRMESDDTASIASVYDEYWGQGGKGGECNFLSAYEETKDGVANRYFSFAANAELTANPIELYKLTYVGKANGMDYTLSDAQSMVTVNNEFTYVGGSESKELSTVGGISEALKTDYVESVVSNQTDTAGTVSVTTYADINLKNEETSINYGEEFISSLVYDVIPKIEIKGENAEQSVVQIIDDKNFDGSEMIISLCVGNMMPKQIIHHKTDGTKEYFYEEHSEQVKKGAKSFSFSEGPNGKGGFVTFMVDSFSDIEILSVAKSEKDNEISYTDEKLKITIGKAGDYTIVLANYADGRLKEIKLLTPTLVKGENTVTDLDGFALANKSKIFLLKDAVSMEPVCEACEVVLE